MGWIHLPLIAVLSCAYAPDFANGELQCSPAHECPKGYSCATDNKCWKTGSGPSSNNDAGSSDTRLAAFVGTWTFNSGANGGTLAGTCTDGSVFNQPLAGDFMTVALGGAGLLAQYYCDNGWSLHLPAGTMTTVVQPNQMCTHRATDQQSGVTTTFVLTAAEFSLTTSDGQAATFAAHLTGPFTATDNTSGSCNFTLTGRLTKTVR